MEKANSKLPKEIEIENKKQEIKTVESIRKLDNQLANLNFNIEFLFKSVNIGLTGEKNDILVGG